MRPSPQVKDPKAKASLLFPGPPHLRMRLKVLLASSRSRRQLRGRSVCTQGEAAMVVEVEATAASDVSDAMAAAAAVAANDDDDTWLEAGGMLLAQLMLGPLLRTEAGGAEPQRAASFSRLIARLLVSVIISCEGMVAERVCVTNANAQFEYLATFESHSHTNAHAPRQMSTPHHTPHQLLPA